MEYAVVVSNIGTVYTSPSYMAAQTVFEQYVAASRSGVGRAGQETVVLTRDGHEIARHEGIEAEHAQL